MVDNGNAAWILRAVGLATTALALFFTFNNILIHWYAWPGVPALFAHLGWFGLGPANPPLEGGALGQAWTQLGIYVAILAAAAVYAWRSPHRTLRADADTLTALSAFIVRGAFWSVVLVGLVDMAISFMRVEGYLHVFIGPQLTTDLGRSAFRGYYVHYPLIAVSFVIAAFTRSLNIVWLALFIVIAEMQIVIARFVFSYEQAFMADLVRFWYAALFLFASAYTLIAEGHVRVDILYTNFSERGKAWANFIGAIVLGIPMCWVVLTRGMWGKTNVINGPMLNFEVTQSGFGLYIKYLMAGFLVVYALSMLIQFVSSCLSNAAVLIGESEPQPAPEQHLDV
jgi:TRAP-type mannitol/chloroaromatic compound transport system permease small subunit